MSFPNFIQFSPLLTLRTNGIQNIPFEKRTSSAYYWHFLGISYVFFTLKHRFQHLFAKEIGNFGRRKVEKVN